MKITLATLPQATKQQVFDQVARHLLLQNSKSTRILNVDSSTCAYRSNIGDKSKQCAAGCLIDDKEYNPDWEGKGWQFLANSGLVPQAHSGFIEELQQVHDTTFPLRWGEELKNIATQHNLIFDKDELCSRKV